jgi:hypothetical protein
MAKNYFSVVNEKNRTFLVNGGTIPIFWMKKVADEAAYKNPGYIVVPIDINDLHKLIPKIPTNEH